jgi:hypothetical protein
MLTNAKTALSLALVLASASVAIGAPKHAAHHQRTIQEQIPAGIYLSLDSVRSAGPLLPTRAANQPSPISPRGYERLERLIEAFEDIGLKEDLGN